MEGGRKIKSTIKVRFDETDAAGIVHFSNYLRYFGIGYADLMDSIGYPALKGGCRVSPNLIFPRRQAYCRYDAPAFFGDTLTLSTRVGELTSKSLTFRFFLRKGSKKIAEGYIECVSVDKRKWQSVTLPKQLLKRLREQLYIE